MNSHTFWFGLTLFFYVASSVSYHAHLFSGSERACRVAVLMLLAGILAHTAAIGVYCSTTHRSVLSGAMPFSLVAYFIVLVQAAANLRPGAAALGSLSMPLAFLAQFYSSVQDPGGSIEGPTGTALLRPHVMVILLGFAAFTVAFCLAVIYLAQSRLLKRKRIRGLFRRLPPLESVSSSAHWLATIGFSLLTLGIISGVIVAPERFGAGWYLDPRTLTSLVAWAIYATYIALSMVLGWRGRKTTYFLIAGFLVVLAAFFASHGRPRTVSHSSTATGTSTVSASHAPVPPRPH